MKTLTISSVSKNVIGAIALFLSLQLSTAQAQTYNGQTALQEDPTVLPALVYPTNKPQTIRINAHNRHRGPLTIVIRDGQGNTKHTEISFASKYIGRFDLAPLGVGTYTFELSNEAGQTFTRMFRIETPESRVIALGDPKEKSIMPTEYFGSIKY